MIHCYGAGRVRCCRNAHTRESITHASIRAYEHYTCKYTSSICKHCACKIMHLGGCLACVSVYQAGRLCVCISSTASGTLVPSTGLLGDGLEPGCAWSQVEIWNLLRCPVPWYRYEVQMTAWNNACVIMHKYLIPLLECLYFMTSYESTNVKGWKCMGSSGAHRGHTPWRELANTANLTLSCISAACQGTMLSFPMCVHASV